VHTLANGEHDESTYTRHALKTSNDCSMGAHEEIASILSRLFGKSIQHVNFTPDKAVIGLMTAWYFSILCEECA
jgi:hypothetical protein